MDVVDGNEIKKRLLKRPGFVRGSQKFDKAERASRIGKAIILEDGRVNQPRKGAKGETAFSVQEINIIPISVLFIFKFPRLLRKHFFFTQKLFSPVSIKHFWCLGIQESERNKSQTDERQKMIIKRVWLQLPQVLSQKRNIMDSEKKINGKRTTHMIFPKKSAWNKRALKLWISSYCCRFFLSFHVPSGSQVANACTARAREMERNKSLWKPWE